MNTAAEVLQFAASELGYTESPAGSNKTKFAAEAGHVNGQPWCATFVVAMARRAGVQLPSESAYTPWMANAFRSRGLWTPGTKGSKPGDIVFFNFDGRGIQHVGIVERGADAYGRIVTIEGNTSSGDAGSQDNGGGVYRRNRTSQYVVGYGRPAYSKEIRAMFEPPLSVCATLKAPNGGVWGLGPDGGVYAFEGAPFYGSAAGQAYFSGRKAAVLEPHPSGGYVIVATSGERYAYPAI